MGITRGILRSTTKKITSAIVTIGAIITGTWDQQTTLNWEQNTSDNWEDFN